MSVVYPLVLPPFDPLTCRYIYDDGITATETGRGRVFNATQVVDPFFRLEGVTSNLMSNAQLRAWQAWRGKLGYGFGTFICPDYSKLYPAAHPGGMAGYAGTGTITAWQANGDVTIGGVNTGFVITEGDLIELRSGVNRTVVMACDASNSGVNRTLTVRGLVQQAAFPVNSTIKFYEPAALFRLTNYSDGDGIRFDTVRFSGRQVLKP